MTITIMTMIISLMFNTPWRRERALRLGGRGRQERKIRNGGNSKETEIEKVEKIQGPAKKEAKRIRSRKTAITKVEARKETITTKEKVEKEIATNLPNPKKTRGRTRKREINQVMRESLSTKSQTKNPQKKMKRRQRTLKRK